MTADTPPDLTDILLNLIVTLLAPIFLSVSGGDINYARAAAFQTVAAYRAQHQADLIAIAQIIAFGLAALDSLSLSMDANLTPSLILRLRSNANACNRSAAQNRRVLSINRTEATAPEPVPEPTNDINEAEIVAEVAAVQQRTEAAQRAQFDAQRTPEQAPITEQAPIPAAALHDNQPNQAMWAAAAARVAGEYTASLPGLPPAQRRAATIRAAILSSCATDLLSGPPILRIKPGDLAAANGHGSI